MTSCSLCAHLRMIRLKKHMVPLESLCIHSLNCFSLRVVNCGMFFWKRVTKKEIVLVCTRINSSINALLKLFCMHHWLKKMNNCVQFDKCVCGCRHESLYCLCDFNSSGFNYYLFPWFKWGYDKCGHLICCLVNQLQSWRRTFSWMMHGLYFLLLQNT